MVAGLRWLLFCASLPLLLSACASSSPVRYYSLHPIDHEFIPAPDDALMLGLGPLRMPDYLNRSQIVRRGTNAEMRVDEFSRWSEPLATALLRTVSANVDNLLPGVVVVMFPYGPVVRDQVNYRLVGDVNRFEADDQGRVVLEVQWAIASTDGDVIVPVRRNRYQTPASSVNDPGAVVTAMSDALAEFSRDIASRLQASM